MQEVASFHLPGEKDDPISCAFSSWCINQFGEKLHGFFKRGKGAFVHSSAAGVLDFMSGLEPEICTVYCIGGEKGTSGYCADLDFANIKMLINEIFFDERNPILISACNGEFLDLAVSKRGETAAEIVIWSKMPGETSVVLENNTELLEKCFGIGVNDIVTEVNLSGLEEGLQKLSGIVGFPMHLSFEEIDKNPEKYGAIKQEHER